MICERGKALSDANADECVAYLGFLADVPDRWISRRKAARFEQGWAPFRGSLSIAARRVAIAALHALFKWLVDAKYLAVNPWTLVNRKLGDDPNLDDLDVDRTRAFTPAAWAALFAQLEREGDSSAAIRLRWLLTFNEAVGMRPAELLGAKRSSLIERHGTWYIKVFGKGSKKRLVPVPSTAVQATRSYFDARGVDFDRALGEAPLIARLDQPDVPVSYSALHQTLKRFIHRALRESSLPSHELRGSESASAHWLRHTHATRAAEREVSFDVLQANLGQADPRTTSRYYKAQMERRAREMERAFGER